jgi:hypothetical protein
VLQLLFATNVLTEPAGAFPELGWVTRPIQYEWAEPGVRMGQ